MLKNRHLPTAKKAEWQGLTLDELQYARMITLARLEIEKSKIIDASEAARASLPFVGSESSMSSVFKSVSKLEYLVIAFKLFRKFAPLFKKKKG